MPNKPLKLLIQQMRVATQMEATEELADSELLDRFVQRCDQAAFELLVWRHGTMVFNLCLRILHREHDAEDAFQATFLALARKASSIGSRKSVGSWLYKVAYRVALRSRATLTVQSLPDEPQVDKTARETLDCAIGSELSSVLDEELSRLPEKYRTAFMLCEMEGHTIDAAARLLGCPSGTIGTRLARARSLLRRRLFRRGIGIPGTFSARMLFAAIPVSLVASTVKAALARTTEQAVTRGLISSRIANLTNGVLRTMILKKWFQTISVIIGLSLLGSVVVQGLEPQAVEPKQPSPLSTPKLSEDKNAGVVLEWKFALNQPIHQELITEVDQIIKIQGNDSKQKQIQSYYFVWTPVENLGDSWRLRLKIQGVKLQFFIGGNESSLAFDSTRDQKSNRDCFKWFEDLVGAEFTMTLDSELKVKKIDGREAFLKKYANVQANANSVDPILKSMIDNILSEDAMRQMAETSFGGLPRGTIRPGEEWSVKTKLAQKPLDEYPLTDRFTYTGQKGKLDKIEIKIEGDLKGNRPATKRGNSEIEGNRSLATMLGNIEVELRRFDGTGTQLFDRAKGRSVSTERNLVIEGKFTTLIAGHATEMDITQTQKTTIKTTDVVPLNWTGITTDPKDREIERLREENAGLRKQLKAIEEVLQKKQ